ncbi:MAG TPA: tetratricopeptide repeat protein [Solimonas sp.]|nr:tetratricopeptide repeat protein [Solimonas sp.]
MIRKFVVWMLYSCLALAPAAWADTLDGGIVALQHGWAEAYYTTPAAQKEKAFEALSARAAELSARNQGRAEPLVWQAIILSSYAKFEGGLGALGKIKAARELLMAAEKIQPTVLDGSIYTSLGSLYAKAPGWPIAYGDKKKAREYLQRALQINPAGIDPNYFYGELLIDQGDRAEGEKYLRKALDAAPRPGREDADAGRRGEIQALLKP